MTIRSFGMENENSISPIDSATYRIKSEFGIEHGSLFFSIIAVYFVGVIVVVRSFASPLMR